jgi:hypothetical protein
MKFAKNFETIGITEKRCTDSYNKVAVAESIGDVSFVLRGLHGPEVGFRHCLTNDNQNNMETIAFTEEKFAEYFHKAAIVKSNGNFSLQVKVAKSVH